MSSSGPDESRSVSSQTGNGGDRSTDSSDSGGPNRDSQRPASQPGRDSESGPNNRSTPDSTLLRDRYLHLRQRVTSAVLWGAVGILGFSVSVQAFLLLGGTVPASYARLILLGVVIGGIVSVVAYATEYRMMQKGTKGLNQNSK